MSNLSNGSLHHVDRTGVEDNWYSIDTEIRQILRFIQTKKDEALRFPHHAGMLSRLLFVQLCQFHESIKETCDQVKQEFDENA